MGWVSIAELLTVDYDQIIEDRRENGWILPPGEGTPMPLREFLGPKFFADLEQLQRAGAERVVFWFD